MTDLSDKLTKLLDENRDVAERLWQMLDRQMYTPDKGAKLRCSRAEYVAYKMIKALPTDYFTAALARVADMWGVHLNWGYIPRSIRDKDERYWVSLDPSVYGEDVEWEISDRAAKQALYVALLERAVEKCGECGGDGKVDVRLPNDYVRRDTCEACNGTGRKYPKLLDALVGGKE